MSALFDPPEIPKMQPAPAPPTVENSEVQRRAEDTRRQLPGRASQFFSDPRANLDPGPSRRRYLGTV